MSSRREINIKYYACFYTDDIINIKDLELDKILVYKKPYQNSFISCIAYKIPHNELSLHITFDRVNGYVEKSDRDKIYYSVLAKNMKQCLIESKTFLAKKVIF